ncbi:MAG TPA: hypothetical protein VGM22_23395 [Methylomirabilota bacterium]|jgi:hypothetical protein
MRDTFSLRAHHWLILIGALVYGTIYAGMLDVRGIASWFANRPEVAKAFSDPNFGRADAIILVFSTLFLGPLALLLGVLMLVFVLAVFGGFLLPVMRWLRLPDWFATVTVLGGVVTALWLYSDLWLPRSLWFVGLLARACKIVISTA